MAEGSSSSRSSPAGGKGKLVLDDPDVVEVSAEAAAGWGPSGRQKRKRKQVFPGNIIELDADDDPDRVAVIGKNTSDQGNKQAVGIHMDWPKHAKPQSDVPDNFAGFSAIPATNVSPWDGQGGFHQNTAGPSAIPATNFYTWGGLGGFHQNIPGPSAIPAGIFYPWDGLGAFHGGTVTPPVYFDQYVAASGGGSYAFNKGIAPVVGPLLPLGHMTSPEMPHQPSQTKIANNETDEKYNAFKQFDTVGEHHDHFYALPVNRKVPAVKKPSKNWVKSIQHEWKVLEKDLPDTIFVRVYEERMDLLRAVIIGPAGTPYHDGLFFFDVQFPSQYPSRPPLVNYRSGGLRLNPNLYNCGKVCLSLLNTWTGSGCEKWIPSSSTMLQVLVSIQALVLNAKPYFNEPAYAMQANTSHGEKMSMAYNEEAFLLSCKTIIYSLRNPPKHFEDFVVGHFRKYGRKILRGCKAYMDGAQVGCLVGDGVQDVDEGDKSCSNNFKVSLKKLFVELQTAFTNIGVDCNEFQNHGATKATADTTMKLKKR